ncbi:MAG: DUF4097 family beta strand repeat protein [Clostridia bacterium]|nr:DUF4097 family beta strand repeat protein [Clostridia bacterium]
MKKKMLCNIIAFLFIIVGLLVIEGVFLAIDFDFSRLNTETYQIGTYRHDADDGLNEIEINTTFFDVKILPMSEGEEAIVYYPYSENIRHEINWIDGKLSIVVVDGRAWYEKWSFVNVETNSTVIEVHLPHRHYEKLKILAGSGDVNVTGEYNGKDVLSFGNVSVETGSGDIAFSATMMKQDTPYNAGFSSGSGDVYLRGIQCVPVSVTTDSGSITLRDCVSTSSFRLRSSSGDIRVDNVASAESEFIHILGDTGDVKLSHVMIGALKVTTDTGDVELLDVLLEGELRIEIDTGDVEIERSDAGSLWIETDTGDVELELLTGKTYFVETDTGDVRHPPQDQGGGQCHVETDTGDVEITLFSDRHHDDQNKKGSILRYSLFAV